MTSGSASLRAGIEAAGVGNAYAIGGRGTESLAIQWILNHLKPGSGQALVVVPDGLLNQTAVLRFIESNTLVRAIVALPSRTFYSTPKKTYILCLERKADQGVVQTEPVFTYLISEIGESRDTRRIKIDQNDLSDMQEEFGYFSSNRQKYASSDPRCKIVPYLQLADKTNWLIDRYWTPDEKVALGIVDEVVEVDAESLKKMVSEAQASLTALLGELE